MEVLHRDLECRVGWRGFGDRYLYSDLPVPDFLYKKKNLKNTQYSVSFSFPNKPRVSLFRLSTYLSIKKKIQGKKFGGGGEPKGFSCREKKSR